MHFSHHIRLLQPPAESHKHHKTALARTVHVQGLRGPETKAMFIILRYAFMGPNALAVYLDVTTLHEQRMRAYGTPYLAITTPVS